MTNNIQFIAHVLVIIAAIGAVTALALDGDVSGATALAVIATLAGASGATAAIGFTAAQAASMPGPAPRAVRNPYSGQ